ncbi:hypothetical protein H4582DRAFT_1919155 [Lactarius indigo]|nr:hypothetical protein H4582DRAFT_1919155 [Lactarius indigo]
MSAFTFDFDLEDDLDESFNVIPPQKTTEINPIDVDNTPEGVSEAELPAEEIPLSELLSTLPEALSYSPLTLPTSGPTLVRRDLFDARFQLLAQGRDEQAALVDAPADLVPGVYEGGLKTWECALDLAAYLDRDVLGAQAGRRVRGLRVLELGCGTAVPTLLLLDRLFAFLASETGDPPLASDGEKPIVPETEIHLQDYNRTVLELVTFPNVLLAWYVSPLSTQYRASVPDLDSDSDDGTVATSTHTSGHERRQGGLTVTPALLAAFDDLARHALGYPYASSSGAGRPYVRTGGPTRGGRHRTTLCLPARRSIAPKRSAHSWACCVQQAAASRGMRPQRSLCLVAAKVLYFGVGGGVQEFVRAVEDERGTVHTVWEHREGVGRRIMRVEW